MSGQAFFQQVSVRKLGERFSASLSNQFQAQPREHTAVVVAGGTLVATGGQTYALQAGAALADGQHVTVINGGRPAAAVMRLKG